MPILIDIDSEGWRATPHVLPDHKREAEAAASKEGPRAAQEVGADVEGGRSAGGAALATLAEGRSGDGERDAADPGTARRRAECRSARADRRLRARASGLTASVMLACITTSTSLRASPLPERAERAIWE